MKLCLKDYFSFKECSILAMLQNDIDDKKLNVIKISKRDLKDKEYKNEYKEQKAVSGVNNGINEKMNRPTVIKK